MDNSSDFQQQRQLPQKKQKRIQSLSAHFSRPAIIIICLVTGIVTILLTALVIVDVQSRTSTIAALPENIWRFMPYNLDPAGLNKRAKRGHFRNVLDLSNDNTDGNDDSSAPASTSPSSMSILQPPSSKSGTAAQIQMNGGFLVSNVNVTLFGNAPRILLRRLASALGFQERLEQN
ncbi:hypothetical protein HDU79_003821 [Rhizoclosmatium sp. JEL0117]|nr:hypothetical protein HDU79_003821 [Rhizoclosmatium sp. JEL0117]